MASEVPHIWGETEEGYQSRVDARERYAQAQIAEQRRGQSEYAVKVEHERLARTVVEAAKVMHRDFTWQGKKSDRAIDSLMTAVDALVEFEAKHVA